MACTFLFTLCSLRDQGWTHSAFANHRTSKNLTFMINKGLLHYFYIGGGIYY